jgi:signal transduction histidine kinase
VLERFYRRPGSRGGGAGLGLPIVAQIAEQHGSRLLLLDGAGGKGLRAEIRLAEVAAPAPAPVQQGAA